MPSCVMFVPTCHICPVLSMYNANSLCVPAARLFLPTLSSAYPLSDRAAGLREQDPLFFMAYGGLVFFISFSE